MCARRLDAGLGDPWVDVALAEAADPLIGVDGDDEAVLRRGGQRLVIVRRQQDVAVDAGDLHDADVSCSLADRSTSGPVPVRASPCQPRWLRNSRVRGT